MIDAHCHIDLFPDPVGVLDEIQNHRIRTIAVSSNLASFRRLQNLCARNPYTLVALGMHPEESPEHIGRLDELWKAIDEYPIIGEVGLDRYFLRDKSLYLMQLLVFESILERCAGKDKLLNVHSRSAERDVLRLLGEYNIERVILHWYVGPQKYLSDAIERGYYFSIGPAVLRTEKVREYVRQVPRHLLLTESDGPTRYGKDLIGRPALVKRVQLAIADIWGTSPQVVEDQIDENFERLLSSGDRVNHSLLIL